MELLTPFSGRLDFSRQSCDAASVAIRDRYGSIPQLINKFNIEKQEYCALNVEAAIRSNVPTLVAFGKAYGEDKIKGILAAHATNVVNTLGENEKIGEEEIDNISQVIWLNPKARVLSFPSVIAFFYYARLGFFKLYSGRVRHFIEAFNEYLPGAIDLELQLKRKIEKEKTEIAARRHAENCITFEQYFRSKGLQPPTSLLAFVQST